jgi:Protein of unknown function (DUF4232)
MDTDLIPSFRANALTSESLSALLLEAVLEGCLMGSLGRAALAAAITSGLALVAGCSAGSPAPAPTVTITKTSSAAASTSPAASPSTTAVAAGPGPCSSSALKVALGSGNAAAGTSYLQVKFTNVSSTTCTLYGFPGVSFTGETYAVQVGPAATRNHASPESLVTLAPGAVATAELSIVDAQNYPPGSCGLTTASGILVYPPNLRTSVGLPYNGYTCVNAKDHVLTVNAVVPASS